MEKTSKKNRDENSRLLEEFISYLAVDKGLSLNTQSAYRQDMLSFISLSGYTLQSFR